MREKRQLERFDLRLPGKIKDGEAGDSLDVMTSDICAGGAFFRTDRSLPTGTVLRIDLLLPLGGLRSWVEEYDHVHIQLTGTVLRKEPLGMAVCFDKGYKVLPGEEGGSCHIGRSL